MWQENVRKKKLCREKLDFLDFEIFLVIFGVVVSFWKIRQFVTISDFDFKGGIFFGRPRRSFWVVSQVIWTNGLASRALFLRESWLFSWFHGGFWKFRQLVTPSDLGWEGSIWTVWVSGPHRDLGEVSSFKNKLSRAVLLISTLKSHGFQPNANYHNNSWIKAQMKKL